MNAIKTIIAGATLTMLFLGCSETNDATKVSNQLVSIEGVAATGYAMTHSNIRIEDAQGNVLYQGETDSVGKYQAKIEQQALLFPIVVSANQGDISWENIVAQNSDSEFVAGIVAHVNPITGMIAETLRLRTQNLAELTKQVCDSIGNESVEALLGEGVQYATFAYKNGYVAAVMGDTTIIPSAEDMIIHTLGERALASGITMQSFLKEQVQQKAQLLIGDSLFQYELKQQMQQFKMDSSSIESGLEGIMEHNQGSLDSTQVKTQQESSDSASENYQDSNQGV